jgi:integrase
LAKTINRLAPNAVKTLSKPGRHADGGGLYLSISENGGRRWTFIYRWKGKAEKNTKIEMGLGAVRDVPLAKAREAAAAARASLAAGINPKDARAPAPAAVPTFGQIAEQLIDSMRPSWKNAKHAAQWEMTLMGRVRDGDGWKPAEHDYCKPLRARPVNTITATDVLAILRPIWDAKPETASRLRGRLERVFAVAKVRGHYAGDNPAAWRDNLKEILPKRRRLTRGHHAAMSYSDVPAFVTKLRAREALAAMALDFTILTAARTEETLGATWPEFELDAVPVTTRDGRGRESSVLGPAWTIPAERMKAGRMHQVPLPDAAVALLRRLKEASRSEYVFPGFKAGRPLSNMAMEKVLQRMGISDATVHGMRSSFRDWSAETTAFPSDVVEMALAHVIANKVEAAYRRGALFEKRRELMTAWAEYVETANAN